MRAILEHIHEIANFTRKRRKAYLLRRYDSPAFRHVLFTAFSPTSDLGVGFPDFHLDDSTTAPDNPISEFQQLVFKLRTRELAGREAKVAALNYVQSFPPGFRETVAEILIGDLQMGCTPEFLNRELDAQVIPTRRMRTVKPYGVRPLRYPVYVTPKPTGIRYLCFVEAGKATLIMHLGKIQRRLPWINEHFVNLSHGVYEIELTHPKFVGTTPGYILQFADQETLDQMCVKVHDFSPWDDWGVGTRRTTQRLSDVKSILNANPHPRVTAAEYIYVRDPFTLLGIHDNYKAQGHLGTWITSAKSYRSWVQYLT